MDSVEMLIQILNCVKPCRTKLGCNISALYKFCVNYFDENLTEENAIDVMNLAYLKNENKLFGKACKFVFKYKLIGEEAWQDMKKNNSDYVIDILEALF